MAPCCTSPQPAFCLDTLHPQQHNFSVFLPLVILLSNGRGEYSTPDDAMVLAGIPCIVIKWIPFVPSPFVTSGQASIKSLSKPVGMKGVFSPSTAGFRFKRRAELPSHSQLARATTILTIFARSLTFYRTTAPAVARGDDRCGHFHQ